MTIEEDLTKITKNTQLPGIFPEQSLINSMVGILKCHINNRESYMCVYVCVFMFVHIYRL